MRVGRRGSASSASSRCLSTRTLGERFPPRDEVDSFVRPRRSSRNGARPSAAGSGSPARPASTSARRSAAEIPSCLRPPLSGDEPGEKERHRCRRHPRNPSRLAERPRPVPLELLRRLGREPGHPRDRRTPAGTGRSPDRRTLSSTSRSLLRKPSYRDSFTSRSHSLVVEVRERLGRVGPRARPGATPELPAAAGGPPPSSPRRGRSRGLRALRPFRGPGRPARSPAPLAPPAAGPPSRGSAAASTSDRRPRATAFGVSRAYAVSAPRRSRCSAREVRRRYGSSAPSVTRSSIITPM